MSTSFTISKLSYLFEWGWSNPLYQINAFLDLIMEAREEDLFFLIILDGFWVSETPKMQY
jgi:hypothetical protein